MSQSSSPVAFSTDVVIIGAGAAGLMCAATAAERGRRVLVLDHANKPGKKILMSGGGRCNFTNLDVQPENYLSANRHFCKSALARYTQWDFIALVQKHRIAYHEKERGQLFCDESSKLILRMLLDECAAGDVDVVTECAVTRIQTLEQGGFLLSTGRGPVHCASLVVATGGLSIPKMGATGFGYSIARQFGHGLCPTRAGLVPVTLSGAPLAQWSALAGLSVEATVSTSDTAFSGGVLVTHRGLSGPAILQISSYWAPGQPLSLDLLPGLDVADWLADQQLERPNVELRTVLSERLPRRLVQQLIEPAFASRPLRQLRPAERQQLGALLSSWRVAASGTEGYRTAEVTLGGVDTAQLSSATMESRLQPGLHFIGEVVDVTGHLGGFNFQWAWASGHAAGEVV